MSNAALIAIYAGLACCTVVLAALVLRRRPLRLLDRRYLLALFSLFGWQVVLVLYYCSKTEAFSRFLYDMSLPFVALSALAWFLYIVRFYGLDGYFSRPVIACLFVIPIATYIVTLTAPFHTLLRTELEFFSFVPVHIVHAVRGPWFWYHAVACYAMMLAAAVISIVQHRRIPRAYRLPSLLLLLGLFVSAAGNALVLTTSISPDPTLLATSAASLLLYLATRNNAGLDFLQRARWESFHGIAKGILILDDEGGLINANSAAEALLAAVSIDIREKAPAQISTRLRLQATYTEIFEDSEAGVDYHFPTGAIYHICYKPIFDNERSEIGTFLMIEDVTRNREMIASLDRVSGMDALTGLLNRRQLQEDLRELDRPERLPLCVIAGDLNHLKRVNDQYGHQQGDAYIQVAAETLRSVCPPNARVFRTGGDEFQILVPNFDLPHAKELTMQIHDAFGRITGYPFTPSIALGYTAKKSPTQPIADIQMEADAFMYANKRGHGRCGTE